MQIHGMNSGSWATIWRTHRRRFLLHKIKQGIMFKRRYIYPHWYTI